VVTRYAKSSGKKKTPGKKWTRSRSDGEGKSLSATGLGERAREINGARASVEVMAVYSYPSDELHIGKAEALRWHREELKGLRL